jgi:hypothetical protein
VEVLGVEQEAKVEVQVEVALTIQTIKVAVIKEINL